MSESISRNEPRPQDPEFLPCQMRMKQLCDDVLALKPEGVILAFWDVVADISPDLVRGKLKEGGLGDLLLKDGETLSSKNISIYQPELNLFVGQTQLCGVSLRAWRWNFDMYRIDPSGPDKPPFNIIDYPGEKDWTQQLDISLHYKGDVHSARETITLQTGSLHAGKLPSLSRDVYSFTYAEMGYEGHNQVHRPAKDAEEVMHIIDLARELFDARVHKTSTRNFR